MLNDQTAEWLDAIAKVLLRCVLLGFALLLLWAAVFVFLPGPIHAQGEMFGLTPHDLSVIHYCGLAFTKICVLLFFLFPYVAIRLVLRK